MGLKGNKVNDDVTHRDREQRLGVGGGRGQFEFQEAPDLLREMFNNKKNLPKESTGLHG